MSYLQQSEPNFFSFLYHYNEWRLLQARIHEKAKFSESLFKNRAGWAKYCVDYFLGKWFLQYNERIRWS